MIHFASRKPRKCPVCAASPVASILWGMPELTPDLEQKLIKGTWTLGGCCIEIPSAMWRCNACGIDIYHEQERIQFEQHD